MKILFAGHIAPGQTSFMRMRALIRLGHTVHGVNTVTPWARASWLSRQVQRRLQRGSLTDEVNSSVLQAAHAVRPDLVWTEKQEFLRADTVHALRALGARVVHFTPDPYFSLDWKRTRIMDDALGAFDVLVYCKSYERPQYEHVGAPLVYMPLGYCDEVHRPLPDRDPRWTCAAGFLGGWEPRREHLLHAIAAAGVDLKVFGGYWDFLRHGRWSLRSAVILRQLAAGEPFEFHRDPLLARAHQGGEVYGDDYARALTGAAIGLGFLRRCAPDQHTTRTFEIPACGSMLLGDRTDEHQALFEEGIEAEYFGDVTELIDKARFYTTHGSARDKVAASGRQRCIDSRYAYIHRLKSALNEIAAVVH